MKINIIIPVYNEEELIEKTLAAIESKLSGEYKIIVIDDFSIDNTREIVKRMAICNKNIRVIPNMFEAGIVGAFKTGLEEVDADSVVVPVMGDFCDQPESINQMYAKILEGYDIVCGSRNIKGGRRVGGRFLKKSFSMLLSRIMHLISGIPCTDLTNSFKMYRRIVLKNINIESKGFEMSIEITIKAYFAGYKIAEIPTVWRDRKAGKSKFHIFNHGLRYFRWTMFALRKQLNH
ncbi:MAG: glycosyltransferase [Candidatus Omnitrophica bacterium]|nr:glycosyltransferase [Candidatus Omnitrophota bacterium]